MFNSQKDNLFKIALILQSSASAVALAVFAYLGKFTRLLADDYYHFSLLETGKSLFTLSVEKYLNVSNRYMTMPLFSLAKWVGVRWMPALMIALWLIGVTWLLVTGVRLPRLLTFTTATLLLFLSILQAPNRFQSIYWISSSVTYFFPLVFDTFLLAGLLAFLRQPRSKIALVALALFSFVAAFLIGGLSETVGALHIAALGILLFAFWIWGKKEQHMPATLLVGMTMLGALISLAVMALSPANAIRSSAAPIALSVFVGRLFIFPYGFIVDTFKSLPLPSLFTVLVGFLIFGNPNVRRTMFKGNQAERLVRLALLLIPLITFALIAASFAPSAYALSYPDARVRFPARVVLTSGLFVEGALVGMWLLREKFRFFATVLLAAAALYPLRGAWQVYQSAPTYQAYAAAWDKRDAYIRSKRDRGNMDISVPPLDGLAGIKEFDISPNHWVNRGAAEYYGVDTISVHSTDLDYDE